MASRRSVPRVALRFVGGCGTGYVVTVRFPFVCCPQYGFLWYFIFFASWWCIFTFRTPRRAGPGSNDGKRSNVLVVVESQDLSELGLCVVRGAASPDPEDGLRCGATPYNSKEESSKGLRPIGPSDARERSSSQSSPVNMTYDIVALSWPRASRRGLTSLIPSTTFSRGHRFGMISVSTCGSQRRGRRSILNAPPLHRASSQSPSRSFQSCVADSKAW